MIDTEFERGYLTAINEIANLLAIEELKFKAFEEERSNTFVTAEPDDYMVYGKRYIVDKVKKKLKEMMTE